MIKGLFNMVQKICYVVGAGDFFGNKINKTVGDYVIAVDGGYQYLQKSAVEIDMVVGDFDSLKEKPVHANMVVLQKEKDDTDMLAALKIGIIKGYKRFFIYGGTGGRIAHTFANFQCLASLSQNHAQGFLFDKHCVITAITNKSIVFDSTHKGYISVLSHSDKAYGVTIKNLKYELDNITVLSTYPIGVSNQFIGKDSIISVEDGTLIVIYEQM